MGARAWPFGGLCPGPVCLGCGTRFAQTVLAPTQGSGLGRSHARRRLEVAPWDGAGTTTKDNDQIQRCWIPDQVGNDRGGGLVGFRPRATGASRKQQVNFL